MTTETVDVPEELGPEQTPGPRVRSEVYILPDTKIEMYDFGSGVGVRIGEFFESYVYIALGFDAESRRDACARLLDVLGACLDFVEKVEPVE